MKIEWLIFNEALQWVGIAYAIWQSELVRKGTLFILQKLKSEGYK